jgi:hypothetical protein
MLQPVVFGTSLSAQEAQAMGIMGLLPSDRPKQASLMHLRGVKSGSPLQVMTVLSLSFLARGIHDERKSLCLFEIIFYA